MVTTMRDIARVAGVSQSTVSRVLNDAADERPDRRRDPGAGHRGGRGAELPAQPPGARPARRPDDAHGRGRARLQRPVLRRRDRGPRGRGHEPRLQHRPGPCPGPARRGHRAVHGARDPAHGRGRAARRHAGPAPPARRPAPLDRARRGHVAGLEPARVPDRRAGRPGRHPGGPEHVVDLGHRRIAFVSAHLQGDFRQREEAYVEFMDERFGGVPDGYLQRSRTRSPAARRRCARCSSCPIRRPPCARRPTSSPSARSTPRTSSAPPCRAGCRSSGSTTS